MADVRLAVIGVGHLGQHHARIFAGLKGCELVAVCDVDPKQARAVARRVRTNWTVDYHDLLGQVDAASIVVPTPLHAAIASAFLEAGAHVFVEKPITSTVEEAQALVELARAKERILQVGHVERFNAAYRAAQALIRQPRFIEVHRLSPFPHRSTDISVVHDLMIHDLDILLGLIQSDVTEIDAVGLSVLTSHEDLANVRLHFANGTIANLTASRLALKRMRKFRIFQENRYIGLDFLTHSVEAYEKRNGKIKRLKPKIDRQEPLPLELAAFIKAIQTNTPPPVLGEDGLRAMRLADAILHHIRK